MTTATQAATTSAATTNRGERRWARLMAVAAAVAAAAAVWVVAEAGFAVDLRAPSSGSRPGFDIGLGLAVFTAALASLTGWGLLALLERLTTRANTIWAVVATATLLVSLGGPLSGTGVNVTAANRAALLAMHLVVAAVLIPRSTAHQPESEAVRVLRRASND